MCLEKDCSNLLPEVSGRNLFLFRLLGCRDTSNKVHLQRLPDLAALKNLVSKVKDHEDRDVNVWRKPSNNKQC